MTFFIYFGGLGFIVFDNIIIVTDLIEDTATPFYDYDTPCPDTPTRVAQINTQRVLNGDSVFTGVPNIAAIPDKILKLCTVNQDEVQTEALAYALTQLSIFEDTGSTPTSCSRNATTTAASWAP